jgi:hypothetical protein
LERSLTFDYVKNFQMYGKSVLGINDVFHFSIQCCSETFLAPINIERVTLEMRAEMHEGFHVVSLLVVRF